MKMIAYTRPDGGVSVVIPFEGARLAYAVTVTGSNGAVSYHPHAQDPIEVGEGVPPPAAPVDGIFRGWAIVGGTEVSWAETEDEFVDRIREKDVPREAVDVTVLESDAIPADRTFRNAWKLEGGSVGHDMVKVKTLAHDKRRAAREAEFAPLDLIIARKIPGHDLKRAETDRQAIRDKYAGVQDAIDAAATVEQVKAALAVPA